MPSKESLGRPPGERYEIVGRIAVGGMAEIYLAQDRDNHREVILKRLMPGLQSDAEFVRMFYDEANIAARLRHPNIVTIFELGELDGSLFIAMELLRGINLRELQMRLNETGRALPLGLGVSIGISALSALDYAHRYTDQFDRSLRVVHRDISPQNIIVTFDGETKLLDFGVAKAEGRLHQTRAGLIKGKFAYMSPEQVSGGTLDGRSDLFALGEVLYELFVRRHPFYAQAEMDMLRAVIDDPAPHPNSVDPNLPKPISNIIMRALQKPPEDRYGTAGLMKKDLEQFATGAGLSMNRGLLARFVQDLFRDRIAKLDEARRTGDIDTLIQAMRVQDGAPAPRPAAPAPQVSPEHPSRYENPNKRDQVVEVATAPADPADAHRLIAHGEARSARSSARRYEKSDVFSAPKLDTPTIRQNRVDLDADLPTVMGHLSADEMAQLREAAAHVRSGGAGPKGLAPQTPERTVPDPAEPALGTQRVPRDRRPHADAQAAEDRTPTRWAEPEDRKPEDADALGRGPHADAQARGPHADALGRGPHADALGRGPHADALQRTARRRAGAAFCGAARRCIAADPPFADVSTRRRRCAA